MTAGNGCQPWFERDPRLLEEQAQILNSAGFKLNEDALNREQRIVFTGSLKADPDRQLVVAFPEAFPSSAPKIYDTPASKLLSRHHRTDTRQLCLFGFNERRWSATLTVANALVEAEELIAKFKESGAEAGDQPPEPITRAIPYVQGAAVLVPPRISTFNDFEKLKLPTGKFTGKFVHEVDPKKGTQGRGIILEAYFGDKKLECARPFHNYLTGGRQIHGDWFYLPTPPTQEGLQGTLKECLRQCKLKKADFYWIALIFREEVKKADDLRLTWLVARASSDGKFHVLRTFPYLQQERYARIPGLEGLGEKRVALIGCGSLGSKIAANLAASGVSRFLLVDCDYFEPNNSVRHELGVECFGLNKEIALLNRLCSLNPAVADGSRFFTFQVASFNPFAAEQQFFEFFRDSDLVIDATAVHSVSHFLNERSFELRVPTLFVSVTNGAWGGEVVRVIPGKTPCWLCWQDEYYDIKPPSAPEAAAEIFAPGCDQPTFTGTTYELGMVANLATSMAVDTLLGGGDLSKNYIRWSGKDETGRPIYLTETLKTNHQKECHLCGSQYGI